MATSRVSEAPASMMVIQEDFMYEPEPLQNLDKESQKPQINVDDDEISIEDDEQRNGSESRTSSEIRAGMLKKITTRRFDIKQLKAAIWKVLEPRLPSYYRSYSRRQTQDFQIHLQKNKDQFSFQDLLHSLASHIENTEMLESMSVH